MNRKTIYTMFALTLISILIVSCAPQQPQATPTPEMEQEVVVDTPEAAEPAPAEAATIRVATDATWPPFEYVDEDTREIVGFDIDLMNAIAERENLNVEYINVGWDPLLAGVAGCQYDAAISAMTITEERRAQFLFSDPYLNAGQIIAVRAAEEGVTTLSDLEGRVVGAQIGTTGAIEIENFGGVTLRPYDTVDLAYLDLINGQIDAVVADYPTAIEFVNSFEGRLKTVGDVFTDEYYGIAVCRNNPELVERFNSGLAAVQTEGLIEELEEKWLTGSEEE
jgi:polar amino acid transport system substrate-binding protein